VGVPDLLEDCPPHLNPTCTLKSPLSIKRPSLKSKTTDTFDIFITALYVAPLLDEKRLFVPAHYRDPILQLPSFDRSQGH
jgi:hypothetical protein